MSKHELFLQLRVIMAWIEIGRLLSLSDNTDMEVVEMKDEVTPSIVSPSCLLLWDWNSVVFILVTVSNDLFRVPVKCILL